MQPLWHRRAPYVIGGLLILTSVSVTIWFGLRSKQDMGASEGVILIVFAAVLQIAAGYAFFRVGRADPTLARSAVRHLFTTLRRADTAGASAQWAFETGNAQEHQDALGRASNALSYIQEDLINAIEDWHEFHADALRDLRIEGERHE